MILRNKNECRICTNVFCCEKCRIQHETNRHAAEVEKLEDILNKCAFCKKNPLPFRPTELSSDLLDHILQNHFPLYCRKCSKIYFCIEDLFASGKCTFAEKSCSLQAGISFAIESPSPVEMMVSTAPSFNPIHQVVASTQTSPSLLELDANQNQHVFTPTISLVNSLTKKPNIDANITDSASVKNISSFNHTTPTASTPMQQLVAKAKGQHFASSSQTSSIIHGSSSESELIVHSAGYSPRVQTNVKARGRGKMPVSATPLRQVMSKSIQRAIAEHGTISLRDKGFQPKKIFDSMPSYITSPLDLRTSPVLRRTQSEIVDRSSVYEEFHTSKTSSRKHIMSSTKQIITEDVIISTNSIYEKLETVYETCRSVESTSIQLTHEKLLKTSSDKVENVFHVTPKTTMGGTLRKTISFDSPKVETLPLPCQDDEIFYTPKSLSPDPNDKSSSSESGRTLGQLRRSLTYPTYDSSSNSKENKENQKPKNFGKFWSLFSSMIRSFSGMKSVENSKDESIGLPKRCASFAGILNNNKCTAEGLAAQQVKRKRTNTIDVTSTVSPDSNDERNILRQPLKKMKRIQGRRPIERMRKM